MNYSFLTERTVYFDIIICKGNCKTILLRIPIVLSGLVFICRAHGSVIDIILWDPTCVCMGGSVGVDMFFSCLELSQDWKCYHGLAILTVESGNCFICLSTVNLKVGDKGLGLSSSQ